MASKTPGRRFPRPLMDHVHFLEEVGFKQVDVVWKNYMYGVYGGKNSIVEKIDLLRFIIILVIPRDLLIPKDLFHHPIRAKFHNIPISLTYTQV